MSLQSHTLLQDHQLQNLQRQRLSLQGPQRALPPLPTMTLLQDGGSASYIFFLIRVADSLKLAGDYGGRPCRCCLLLHTLSTRYGIRTMRRLYRPFAEDNAVVWKEEPRLFVVGEMPTPLQAPRDENAKDG